MSASSIVEFEFKGNRRGIKRIAQSESESETEDSAMRGSLESLSSFLVPPSPSPSVPSSTLADALELAYVEKRNELISDDGSISTPLKVLKDMAFEYGTSMEVTTYEIHLPPAFPGQRNVQNRIFLKVGEYTGNGESARHRLAVQLAAGDLLEQIKGSPKGQGGAVADCGLLPGCRVSPLIYEDLREFCRMEKLAGLPSFVQTNPSSINSTDLFAFKCSIGSIDTFGTSDSIFLAKRLAAKKMYETLTAEVYPDDRTATGSGCLRFQDMEALGIKPIISVRAMDRAIKWDASVQQQKRALDSSEGLHTDDFDEEEDHVVLLKEQLHLMQITDMKQKQKIENLVY